MQIKLLQVGPLGTNCYLLEDEKNKLAAVVDPGGDAGRILSQARADGVEILLILLTHAHFDHTGGVAELHAALPDVPVYLHPDDAVLLGSEVFPAIGAPTVPYGEGGQGKAGRSGDPGAPHPRPHPRRGVPAGGGRPVHRGHPVLRLHGPHRLCRRVL